MSFEIQMIPEQMIKEGIILTAEYYQFPISENQIAMYYADLLDLDPREIMRAYQTYRKNPRNTKMPLPSAIRAIVNPEIDDDTFSVSTASKVLEAVARFGYTNPTEARDYVGELGWVAVKRFGGWTEICETLGTSKLPKATFQAQIREIVKSEVKVLKAGGTLPTIEFYEKQQISAPDNVVSLLKSKEMP